MSITFEVTKNTAIPRLQELQARLTPQRMGAAAGPAVARVVQRHLVSIKGNKRGWPTTHFLERAARSTSWQSVAEGVLVSINQVGMRQRYHGGPIKPVKADALAIPISPVSYGHVPRDFPGLFLLKTPKGAYLAQRVGAQEGETKAQKGKRIRGLGGNWKRRKGTGLNLLFKLSGGVNQAADPGVLPDKGAMTTAALDAILASLKRRGQG
jgi:hypothetical protein